MNALPTGTITFLFTEIEDFTALLQRLGDRRYAEVLAGHRRLLPRHVRRTERTGDRNPSSSGIVSVMAETEPSTICL